MTALDRDRMQVGLRELIERLHAAGQPATIALVGGAALVLRYFHRRVTADIEHEPSCGVEELYEAFYPGDALTDRALRMVTGLIASGLPPRPTPHR